jgi:cell wall-associated NlpC family hydrolase
MKIKKVDDKPMVIHTKKKAELHTHMARHVEVKGANVLTSSRGDKGRTISGISKNRLAKTKMSERSRKGMAAHLRSAIMESKKSVRTKTGSIRIAGSAGVQTALSKMEGGDEIRDAAHVANVVGMPAVRIAGGTPDIAKKHAIEAAKKRIKKAKAGKKIAKKTAKDTAKKAAKDTAKETAKLAAKETAKVTAKTAATAAGTAAGAEAGPLAPVIGVAVGEAVGKKVGEEIDKANVKANSRSRKIRFFLDKMKENDKQQDSVGKMVRDLLLNRLSIPAKKMTKAVAGFFLMLVLLIAVTVTPIVGVIAVLYNSPFAFFLPPLEEGDTVTTVTSAYMQDFNREINDLINKHSGCDTGQIVYVDAEGQQAGNYNDIIAVYMVKYGVEDTAAIMNDTSKMRLKEVFDDMCSYTTSTGSEQIKQDDGKKVKQTVFYVNVKLKHYTDMITEYAFDDNRKELVAQMMSMFGSSTGVTPQSSLTQKEIDDWVKDIKDAKQKKAVTFALTRVGYPYSQELRHSGRAYDCSSLVYYAWLEAGVDISYGGATTAGYEAQGLDLAGKGVRYEDIQPGDLIFYCFDPNEGGYLHIGHVAIYVGNGMMVDARDTAYGVVFRQVVAPDCIVFVGRP